MSVETPAAASWERRFRFEEFEGRSPGPAARYEARESIEHERSVKQR